MCIREVCYPIQSEYGFVYATHANVELCGKLTMELLGMKMQRIRRFLRPVML